MPIILGAVAVVVVAAVIVPIALLSAVRVENEIVDTGSN